jgi:hypothetical protein
LATPASRLDTERKLIEGMVSASLVSHLHDVCNSGEMASERQPSSPRKTVGQNHCFFRISWPGRRAAALRGASPIVELRDCASTVGGAQRDPQPTGAAALVAFRYCGRHGIGCFRHRLLERYWRPVNGANVLSSICSSTRSLPVRTPANATCALQNVVNAAAARMSSRSLP